MKATGTFMLGLLGTLALLPRNGAAQDAADLANLVFEPLPLTSTAGAAIEAGLSSATADAAELAISISRQVEAVEELRASGFDAELVEQLDLLATAYQAVDRHGAAIEALEEAVAIVREAGGRDSLEQARLEERKIPSYLALGDLGDVDDTQQRIFELYERNFRPGSRQMYYATIKLADWHTAAYYRESYRPDSPFLKRQRSVVPRPQRCIRAPAFSVGESPGDCNAISILNGSIKDVFDQDINDARLRKIDRLYADYQDAMIEADSARLDVVVDLAKRVARLAYATKQEMDFERYNYTYDRNYDGSREQAARNSPARLDESYDSGVQALRYAIATLRSVDGVRPEAVVAGLLNLGDWHLAYGKAAAAEDVYREAYETLTEAGFSREDIDTALATELPIRIPVFATHLYTRLSTGLGEDVELDFKGYLDLSHKVDTLGNAVDVRILGGSADDSSRIQTLLRQQLRSMKFRPDISGGELSSPGRIEARYYYAY